MVIHYVMESQSYSITQLLKPWITLYLNYHTPWYLLACRLTQLTQDSVNFKYNSYSPRGFELAELYCTYDFSVGMPMKDWQQTMMDG